MRVISNSTTLLATALTSSPRIVAAFTTVSYYHLHSHSSYSSCQHRTTTSSDPLRSAVLPNAGGDTSEILQEEESVHEFVLLEHKPMGCTVEESLAPEPDATTPVFISKVVEGGNAEKAGLAAGDVIMAITGVFDKLEDVSHSNVDRVRSLVGGRLPSKELTIWVLRGTDVMARHESVLVDLCTVDADADMDDCIHTIMNEIELNSLATETGINADCDPEGECLLDAMADFWTAETDDVFGTDTVEEEAPNQAGPTAEPAKKQARPWASRSSPSGTYVRDPVTGKLRNIS